MSFRENIHKINSDITYGDELKLSSITTVRYIEEVWVMVQSTAKVLSPYLPPLFIYRLYSVY